ncbi:LysR family transcriptional regulator [Novisyntrophococcus fermenticellae]|uniref:LysR family transcriptional regulator n=1 Tax=Novisyntrophococcus fermenticellae TaxID=2068655 RepID=UPI001E5DB8D8|nr:LysR family transcriptional regulator [Novisyntrophococcus fermenticellae]
MHSRTIKCFISVAESLNFTKAAHENFVTQTTISRQIASLEEELGFSLFERNTVKVVLTPAGRSLYCDLKRIVKECDAVISKAKEISTNIKGTLKLGYSTDLGPKCILDIIPIFQDLNNNVKITLNQETPINLISQLQNGSYDIIAILTPELHNYKDIVSVPACRYNILLAMSKNHPLATRSEIPSKDLRNYKICTASKRDAPGMYEYALEAFRKDGYEPALLETDTYESQKLMAILGEGIAFYPDTGEISEKDHRLSYAHLTETHHSYSIDYAWLQDNKNIYIKKFIDTVDAFNDR